MSIRLPALCLCLLALSTASLAQSPVAMPAHARGDYSALNSRFRGQFLLGWTPNPGSAFYVGYNDDLTRDGFSPFSGQLEPGFRRNGRTFFVKMSYLFRRSFGG